MKLETVCQEVLEKKFSSTAAQCGSVWIVAFELRAKGVCHVQEAVGEISLLRSYT